MTIQNELSGDLSGAPSDETTSVKHISIPSHWEVRDQLQEMVVKDLLGPAGGETEEITDERVKERYITGMLAPVKQTGEIEEVIEIAEGGVDSADEGNTDLSIGQTRGFFPSSMGLTFTIDGEIETFKVTAKWGRYDKQISETLKDPKTGNSLRVWKRTPISNSTNLTLKEGHIEPWIVSDEHPEVGVRGRIRKRNSNWIVTLFLVNGQEEPKQNKDGHWLFQAELIVESTDGKAVFAQQHHKNQDTSHIDPLTLREIGSLEMLYRDRVEFAVGHGVAVQADINPENPQQAFRISTTFLPNHEVPKQTPPLNEDNPNLAGIILDMKVLSESEDEELVNYLKPLVDAYSNWIDNEVRKIDDPTFGLSGHIDAAKDAIERCRNTQRRISDGIQLLADDSVASEAFRFANEAMYLQRIHSIHSQEVRRGKRQPNDDLNDIDIPENRTWYPFQLAFILLNLPGTTDLKHPERSIKPDAIADLLWFPTGGGKTEAYLGLAAYVLAIRRLQGEIEGRSGEYGIGVLMRYTLRLLTLQQFQRATALICACEVIRREYPEKWGENPFRIGLWVGMKLTPNKTEHAAESISQTKGAKGYEYSYGSPKQLTSCPWCGTKIEEGRHIKVESGPSTRWRTFIYCGDSLGQCPFSERNSPSDGIPALVVDEEIYRNPPSLLIATVDKFAQMPWNGQVQMLFGQVNKHCSRHGFRSPETDDAEYHPKRGSMPAAHSLPHNPLRPPDLVIQDELHLISGPLGSMVGLYETAIEGLCTWEVEDQAVRPKVIASTATIRRASEQVNHLFARKVNIFPPQGTHIKDNFFSIEREPDSENPGRRYLGICSIGRRFPATLIRVYLALLAASQKLYVDNDTVVDPWMTLVGYYNSLRELGGARRLVEDDIRSRLRHADERGLAQRYLRYPEELTSRKSGDQIPAILDRLEVGFSQDDDRRRAELRKQKKPVDIPYPLDVVLATNMISVGVDVNRLGLMVVTGQPKTTAEYIQATSRVGRKHPGLVFTIYNWARPRDLSHYERFEHYHSTFYKHVEALSVTPFAARALDRGLTGVLVSLVRLANEELNPNQSAQKLPRKSPIMDNAMSIIKNRGEAVGCEPSELNEIDHQMQIRREDWLKTIENATTYKLGYKGDKDTMALLRKPGLNKWDRFTCLNSLRDVEPSVNLIMSDDRGMEPEIHVVRKAGGTVDE